MHLRIDREHLRAMMSDVIDAVARASSVPIIGHVLLEAEENTLAITGTNIDQQVRTSRTDDNLDGSGSVTVNGDLLHKIAQRLPKGEVQLSSMDDGRILVNSATGSQFHLYALPEDDFPLMEAAVGGILNVTTFSIPGKQLALLINHTIHAVSGEETRFYLNGIFLHKAEAESGDVLRAVTTDGHRLAMEEVELPEGAGSLSGIILPTKAAHLAHKLFKGSETVHFVLGNRLLEISNGQTILTTKLVDATYLDYARVVPDALQTPVLVDRGAISDAVARMMLLPAGKKSRGIHLKLALDGQLVLSSNDGNGQDGNEPLPITYTGEALDIGFNGAYLLDVLSRIEGTEVELHMKDSGSPALIFDPARRTACHVIMPMRV